MSHRRQSKTDKLEENSSFAYQSRVNLRTDLRFELINFSLFNDIFTSFILNRIFIFIYCSLMYYT